MFIGALSQPSGFVGLELSVPETTPGTPTFVGDIECLGADPSTVAFTLEGSVPFQLLSPANLVVQLHRTEALDYETGPRYYQFNITCCDSTSCINGNVQLSITSVNEFVPHLHISPGSAVIEEDRATGTIVLSQDSNGVFKLTASDGDEGEDGQLTFTATSDYSEFNALFAVNASDGTVTLSAQLDLDLKRTTFLHISVTITVCDHETSPGVCPNAVLNIFVTSVNEFDPEFSQASYATINAAYFEGTYSNEVIAMVECSDRDWSMGSFKDIELQPLPANLSQVVDIMVKIAPNAQNGTGQVVLNGTLDYDTIRQSQLQIGIRCYDSATPPREDVAIVVLNIQDIDDNLPVFSQEAYSKTISEALTVGAEVLNIQCSDGDFGIGSLVGVELLNATGSSVNDTFFLDPNTGILILERSLNFDSGLQEYLLMVRCYDTSGNEAITNITISVTGINVEPLRFNQTLYQFTVDRLELPNDVTVGQVQTHGGDLGQKTTITYTIESNPNFGIDNNGNILLQNFILYAEGDQFQFSVFASDGENQTAEAVVALTVKGYLSLLDIIFIVIAALLLLLIIAIFICCCCGSAHKRK